MIPWAKGRLAGQALDASFIGPSFGLNKRKYYRNFGSPRYDFLLEEFFSRLPHHTFTEADYRETGEIAFDRAISQWASKNGLRDRSSFIVEVGGMWGGYPAIRNARSFLWARLLNSRHALSNVHNALSQLDPEKLFVAVHMRTAASEFSSVDPSTSARGRFNILVPGDWYLQVCEAIASRFRGRVQFRIFTDKGGAADQEAVRRFSPDQIPSRGLTECSDLLLLAMADLRIYSVSSYSLVAGFLSQGPYVWYEPQLTLEDGMYSLWGHEAAQQRAGSRTREASAFLASRDGSAGSDAQRPAACLGYPMNGGDALPPKLTELLEQKLETKDWRTNLLDYGCFPIS